MFRDDKSRTVSLFTFLEVKTTFPKTSTIWIELIWVFSEEIFQTEFAGLGDTEKYFTSKVSVANGATTNDQAPVTLFKLILYALPAPGNGIKISPPPPAAPFCAVPVKAKLFPPFVDTPQPTW